MQYPFRSPTAAPVKIVRTRRGTDISASEASDRKQAGSPASTKVRKSADGTTRKRQQGSSDLKDTTKQKKQKRSAESPPSLEQHVKKEPKKEAEIERPRFTSPVLEFDHDRSQLCDPRSTPGRKRRPRYEEVDIPEDLKADILEKYYIPKPENPKGRLNAFQKNEHFRKESRLNPMALFYDLYVCREKGRRGPPTYDSAGFELGQDEVENWFTPKTYNRSRIVGGMQRHLDKQAREEREIHQIFFKDSSPPEDDTWVDYVKDHVSKDLDIPWHQIGAKELRQWEEKGFEKQEYQKWWHEPNEEKRKRMGKMQSGCELRRKL